MATWLEAQEGTSARGAAPREYLTARRTVTAAQLMAIDANPITLVPAPGPGKALIPISSIVSGAGGAPFDQANGNLSIVYSGRHLSGSIFSSMPNVGGYPEPFHVLLTPPDLTDVFENEGLVLSTDAPGNGEIANVEYPIEITLEYEIVDL